MGRIVVKVEKSAAGRVWHRKRSHAWVLDIYNAS